MKKTISEKLSNLVSGDTLFDFLKYSTPTSGRGPKDKVIFLVFRPGESAPFLCLKTIRNYDAREAIIRNYDNLAKLNKLTVGNACSQMFAQALYLHDDGENIFSIETACPGRRMELGEEGFAKLLEQYTDFQKHLAKNAGESVVILTQFASEIIKKSKIEEGEGHKILEYVKLFQSQSLKLPRLIQLGDLSEDNVLVSKNGFSIIDYDFVGVTDIPGFDLYGLFNRYSASRTKELCSKYLPGYFRSIGVSSDDGAHNGMLFLYFLVECALRKPHARETLTAVRIISDFKSTYKL